MLLRDLIWAAPFLMKLGIALVFFIFGVMKADVLNQIFVKLQRQLRVHYFLHRFQVFLTTSPLAIHLTRPELLLVVLPVYRPMHVLVRVLVSITRIIWIIQMMPVILCLL